MKQHKTVKSEKLRVSKREQSPSFCRETEEGNFSSLPFWNPTTYDAKVRVKAINNMFFKNNQ